MMGFLGALFRLLRELIQESAPSKYSADPNLVAAIVAMFLAFVLALLVLR